MAGKFLDDLVFKVIADTKGAVEGLTKVGDKAQQLNKHTKSAGSGAEALFNKIKVGGAIAAAAVAVVGGAIGALAVSAAAAAARQEEELRRLTLTLKNTVGATEESASSIHAWIEEVALASGITTDKLVPAFEAFARATRDVTTSQKMMGLAMDISAGLGADLQMVAMALGEAYKGNYSQLTRLRTGISQATLETKDFALITKELASIFEGQAEGAAMTLQGSLARMKIGFEQIQEGIGTMLLPAFKLIADIINRAVLPAIRRWLENAQKHPEVAKNMMKSTAELINFLTDLGGIFLMLSSGLVLFLSYLARVVQGIGFVTGNKGMKDWGRETAESLSNAADSINKLGLKLMEFDAKKYISKFDFSKVKLPSLTGDISGGITGGTPPKNKEVPKLASDWNDAAKAILEAARSIKASFTSIISFNFRRVIDDLSLDPLVVSMRDAVLATEDYVKAQNEFVRTTRESAKADLEYVKSMKDITEEGKKKTEALKQVVTTAKDAAIMAANDAKAALQRISDAQRAFVDETVSRIKSMRDAFKQATQVSLGGIAGSISDAKRNIAMAKENLATAEKALLDAQNRFKSNAAAKAYEGVILDISLPVFQAEKDAVEKAKKDLAIALGEEKNPYAATAEELLKALQNAYDDAVALSKVSGDLAALGFSQDFIKQIIEAGPDLGNELGSAILKADRATQDAMRKVFDGITEVSNTGVNDLSLKMNEDAIKLMESFIDGLKTIEDPLDALLDALEARFAQMISTIEDAIKSIKEQIEALASIKFETPQFDFSSSGSLGIQVDAAIEAAKATAEAEEAARIAAEAEAAAAEAAAEAAAANATTLEIDSMLALMEAGLGWTLGQSANTMASAYDVRSREAGFGSMVNVNVSTNADPYEIGSATAFAIRTQADASYRYTGTPRATIR